MQYVTLVRNPAWDVYGIFEDAETAQLWIDQQDDPAHTHNYKMTTFRIITKEDIE